MCGRFKSSQVLFQNSFWPLSRGIKQYKVTHQVGVKVEVAAYYRWPLIKRLFYTVLNVLTFFFDWGGGGGGALTTGSSRGEGGCIIGGLAVLWRATAVKIANYSKFGNDWKTTAPRGYFEYLICSLCRQLLQSFTRSHAHNFVTLSSTEAPSVEIWGENGKKWEGGGGGTEKLGAHGGWQEWEKELRSFSLASIPRTL